MSRISLVLICTLLLAGCAAADTPRDWTVSERLRGAHCGETASGARWMGAEEEPRVTDDPLPEGRRRLMLSMGEQRTAGYGLSLAEPQLAVSQGVATVQVRWQEPDPDAMVAQVITRPCVVLALPAGGYERVEVMDQAGRLRITIPRSPGGAEGGNPGS